MYPVRAIRASLTAFALRSTRQSTSTSAIKGLPSPSFSLPLSSSFSLYSYPSTRNPFAQPSSSPAAPCAHASRTHFPQFPCLRLMIAQRLSGTPTANSSLTLSSSRWTKRPFPTLAARITIAVRPSLLPLDPGRLPFRLAGIHDTRRRPRPVLRPLLRLQRASIRSRRSTGSTGTATSARLPASCSRQFSSQSDTAPSVPSTLQAPSYLQITPGHLAFHSISAGDRA
ncbi:uncharacterized protein BDZ99DRAFT_19201 [Mytilinidion resinicola]|uniref:Uncharacterized protein n=1 Tax=Mytilinidion resinicola TaxID=574789 RepID=A0A6A6Z988_9PEZI|nr:uncharacterized protein BDZ99DRAFT_19201 [Mytilinidion resinicola]KAF2817576.1 hypothetical protein BDZ99DRAFT_19201 [Mytilinidion resinicola]